MYIYGQPGVDAVVSHCLICLHWVHFFILSFKSFFTEKTNIYWEYLFKKSYFSTPGETKIRANLCFKYTSECFKEGGFNENIFDFSTEAKPTDWLFCSPTYQGRHFIVGLPSFSFPHSHANSRDERESTRRVPIRLSWQALSAPRERWLTLLLT